MDERFSASSVAGLRHDLAESLGRAYEQAGSPAGAEAMSRCLPTLEALATTAKEYLLLRNRLRNAHRYSLLSERGAARFEIRQMLTELAD